MNSNQDPINERKTEISNSLNTSKNALRIKSTGVQALNYLR